MSGHTQHHPVTVPYLENHDWIQCFGVRGQMGCSVVCSKSVTKNRDSFRVGETAEQQVKRQVPGLTATERSVLRSVCCGAWTGHKCRSDGSCLNCETGLRPTWEQMLECTKLNFDAVDFSEIPQTIVDELRTTVETKTFAACAMMPMSYWTPLRGTPVEHEARRESSRKKLRERVSSTHNAARSLRWKLEERCGTNLEPSAGTAGCDRTSR